MSKNTVGHIGYVPGSQVAPIFVRTLNATSASDRAGVWVAPADVVVESVSVIAGAAVTGDNTNRINLNIRNGGANGAGNTLIGQVQFTSGVNINKDNSLLIPCSGPGTTMQPGDKLIIEAERVGTGGTWTNAGGHVRFRYV